MENARSRRAAAKTTAVELDTVLCANTPLDALCHAEHSGFLTPADGHSMPVPSFAGQLLGDGRAAQLA